MMSLLYIHKTMMISLILLLLKLQSLMQLTVSSSSLQKNRPFANPGCQNQCGDVRIPYPFGIGVGCYYNASYEITCNTSTSLHPPKLFLHQFNLEVIDIYWSGRFSRRDLSEHHGFGSDQVLLVGNLFKKNMCSSETPVIDLRGTPYRLTWDNEFIVEGCGANVVVRNSSGDIITGCASICTDHGSKKNRAAALCYGVGCCQSSLDQSAINFYKIDFRHETGLSNSQTCNVSAGLVYGKLVPNFVGNLSSMKVVPTVLQWRMPFSEKKKLPSGITCSPNFLSIEECSCDLKHGYFGNPHLSHGCNLMTECQKCKHDCAFNQTNGNGTGYYYCKKYHHHLFNQASILGFSISTGSVVVLLVCYWLYRLIKRVKEAKQRVIYFKRNGGLLLQQHISSRDGIVNTTRIFGYSELENATNNFSEDRILGQGGQGTVYKGMLVDGSIVAIKKSMKVEKSQLEQFINEMVILSLVNHRSVVKLLGCCLETEVPLVVYEFISNGTLYQHIHDPSEDFHITWRMRLQIASESASALAYLHSSTSAPIYHRDIKSSNILLDDKYRAKVSDFGTSRAITIEQTHVTTCIQGTFGYLDPEYFQSNQFTEKSDVYSFGVVLVELITGRKPINPNKSGGWISLAAEFLLQMENNFCLFDILDTHISEEAKEDELNAVANLARRCLKMKGKERPTMKEVAVLLDGIRSPHLPKPIGPEYLESSEYVVTEYNCPFSASTSFLDNSPHASLSIEEALPLMSTISQ